MGGGARRGPPLVRKAWTSSDGACARLQKVQPPRGATQCSSHVPLCMFFETESRGICVAMAIRQDIAKYACTALKRCIFLTLSVRTWPFICIVLARHMTCEACVFMALLSETALWLGLAKLAPPVENDSSARAYNRQPYLSSLGRT